MLSAPSISTLTLPRPVVLMEIVILQIAEDSVLAYSQFSVTSFSRIVVNDKYLNLLPP